MTKSAYIHIPFCEHICHYCDFNKVFIKNQPVDEYLSFLKQEIKNTLSCYPSKGIETIFIGGGTPTALNAKQMETLMTIIHDELKPGYELNEFAIEANPGDLSKEKLKILKDAGINRLSFGVQSFNDERLKVIGRTHQKKDVFKTLNDANNAGFTNVSIDLMFSLPGQTLEEFNETLDIALELGVNHYSAYSLIIEAKTVFYNLLRKGKLHLPPQEEEAAMYELLMDKMENNGYNQYEISNFSLPGFESLHNLRYWDNDFYYGFGAGAHSYVEEKRRVNAGPLKKYMTLIQENNFPYIDEHLVTITEKIEEEMFLGLRKTAGINKYHFYQKFGKHPEQIFEQQLEDLSKKDLIINNQEAIFLTRKGKLLGNEVFQAFLA